jgi:polysaccharide chain length determinant protein (PEP-CTERM system associated)
MEERPFDPLDYLAVVKRRKRWLIVPILLSLLVGAALARWLPRKYVANVEVGVTAPDVAGEIVGTGVAMTPEDRLRAVSQQLRGRAILERVAREEGMDKQMTLDKAVERLYQRTKVSLPPSALVDDRSRIDSFLVSHTAGTATAAQRLTNRIAEVFVDEQSKSLAARAEGTSAFLGQQLEASQKRLGDLGERLRRAKEVYMGRLPEQTDSNLSMANGLRQQLEATAMALRGEQDRLSMIERQIEFMRQVPAAPVAPSSGPEGPRPAATRVAMLEHELAQARAMYTEKHPEIQRLQEELAEARQAAKAEAAAARAPAVVDEDRLALLDRDPAYRQLLNDRDIARRRIDDLQRADAQTRSQITLYQSRVESAPLVDQQLTALTREYELEKTNYASLVGRHKDALVAEQLQRQRGGEKFSVLYPALLPTAPDSPKLIRVLLLSILGGIALGIGLVAGREYMDRSVHDVRGLQQQFDVPVLGEISRIRRTFEPHEVRG